VLQYISGFIHIYAHIHSHAVTYTNIHGYENRQTAVKQYIYQIVKKIVTCLRYRKIYISII